MPDGTLVDDAANKALLLQCVDARVAISYTGIADIAGMRTNTWLRQRLESLWQTSTLLEIGNVLRGDLTAALRRQSHISNRQLTVVFNGYRGGLPFWGCITNETDPFADHLTPVLPQFSLHSIETRQLMTKRAFVAVSGSLRAVPDAVDKRLASRTRRYYRQQAKETAVEFVRYVFASAAHSTHGQYVGGHATAFILLPNGTSYGTAFSTHANGRTFMQQAFEYIGPPQTVRLVIP